MGSPLIWFGSKAKLLKSTLNLNGGSEIITGTVDPSAGAGVVASLGSLYLNSTTGVQYRKSGAGDTAWVNSGSSTDLTEITTNVTPTAATSGTLNIGAFGRYWNFITAFAFRTYDAFDQVGMIISSKNDQSMPSGVTAYNYIRNVTAGQLFGLWTATGTSSSEIRIETGNGTAGNSGDINLKVGTSTATQGKIVLDALTAQMKTNIVPDTAGSRSIGTSSLPFGSTNSRAVNVFDAANNSKLALSGGTVTTPAGVANQASVINYFGPTSGVGLNANGIAIYTDSGANVSSESGKINIETGNATGASSSSGNITIQTGTGTSGRGRIILDGSAVNISNAVVSDMYRSVTSTYTATSNDSILALSGASFTLTLPDPTTNAGKQFTIMHNGTSLTQLYTLAGGTVGGVASGSYVLHTNGETLKIVSNGTSYLVLEHKTDMGWIDGGAITITAATTNPTKGTATIDRTYWKRMGDTALFEMIYQHEGAAGTTGSGAYFYTLPTGMTGNPYVTAFVTSTDNRIGSSRIGQASAILTGSTQALGMVYPYDLTRVSTWFTGVGPISSTYFALNNANLGIRLNFTLRMQGWQP